MQLKPVGSRGLRNPTFNELEDSLPDLAQPVPIVVSLSFSLRIFVAGFYFFYSWKQASEMQLRVRATIITRCS